MQRVEARRRASGAALLLITAALCAAPASANTRSQQLYAQALVPFHAQRWEQARQLLDEAAAADPNDAAVFYYRGLANARLGLRDQAITDLERALSIRPDLQPAVLDLGILYFESGQYPEAQEWLERAYRQPANRFSAALFLGLTKLRLGDPQGAEPLLVDAAKDPSLRQSARYYQAVALLRRGETSQAREALIEVQNGPPDNETTQLARQYLLAPPPAASGDGKPWGVYARGGFGYDSNVVLAPDNVNLGPGQTLHNCYTQVGGVCVPLDTEGQEDGFFAVALGGKYRFLEGSFGDASLGFDFYNSVHFQTSSFDLQNYTLHLDLASTRQAGFIQLGASGFYDFYMLDYQSFYNQGRFVPWVTFFEGDALATQIYYQFISQDYSRGPFSPFRDAYNNAFGARQFILLGAADRFMSIGYQWADNDPLSRDGTDFAYTDNIFDLRFDFGLFDWVHGTLGYAVDLQDYEHKNSRTGFSIRRHDFNNQIVVRFVREITSYLTADLAYYGFINDSNIIDFQYDKNIVAASVQVHF